MFLTSALVSIGLTVEYRRKQSPQNQRKQDKEVLLRYRN